MKKKAPACSDGFPVSPRSVYQTNTATEKNHNKSRAEVTLAAPVLNVHLLFYMEIKTDKDIFSFYMDDDDDDDDVVRCNHHICNKSVPELKLKFEYNFTSCLIFLVGG